MKKRDGILRLKYRLIKWISMKDFIYKLSLSVVANRIVHGEHRLTPQYLTDRGWIYKDGYFIESQIKNRDKIWIQFEHHYYRVWHGPNRTFIGLESTVEWFENYYLLIHGDNGRYELAGV